MIGLQHGSKQEADILEGVLKILQDPKLFTLKIQQLNAATNQHRVAVDAHVKAKAEAEAKLAEVETRAAAVAKAEAELKQYQAELESTRAKLTAETRRLGDHMTAHLQAVAAHDAKSRDHAQKEQQLKDDQLQHSAMLEQFRAREEAVKKAEIAHLERVRKLKELIG